jgi:hypothetical protein
MQLAQASGGGKEMKAALEKAEEEAEVRDEAMENTGCQQIVCRFWLRLGLAELIKCT